MKCKISVVTVCYNSENTIKRTFESLLKQSVLNFEHIIIDGQSSDGTLDIVERYAQTAPYKVKVISEPDNGIYDAMNKGILQSNGDYIGILNSDDRYNKRTIESISNVLMEQSPNIIYGYIRVMKGDDEIIVRRGNLNYVEDLNGLIQHPTCFISKNTYENFGLYDTSYKICADQDFMHRVISKGATTYALNEILTEFSIGGASYNTDAESERLRYKFEHGLISKKTMLIKLTLFKIKKVIKVFL
ncbi:glycosyltransferase family 2 protein [Psychromonas sp.]|uniref:glycosyltransferase family 2 protein n=1 Tax=Psychromonas sp. TaxID=1884585 RepID=UPI003A96DBCF